MAYPYIEQLDAYYQAGIAVVARQNGIDIRQLTLGFGGGVVLEPAATFCKLNAGCNFERVSDIEDYVTACVAGVAGRLILSEFRRPQIANSFGVAGLEMKQVRLLLESSDREVDRAFAIAFGCLGRIDDGDAEATIYRLWKRALASLRNSPQREQLDQVARGLLEAGELNRDDIRRLLDG